MKKFSNVIKIAFIVLVLILATRPVVQAHEPIFGIGPHTIYKGGIGIEVERESKAGHEEYETEIIYGLTPDLSLTFVAPFEQNSVDSFGLRIKYRFYRKDSLGTQDQIAYFLGKTFSRVTTGASWPTLYGLTGGRESLHLYYFGSIRYLTYPETFFTDIVLGYRFTKVSYYAWDPVWIIEWNRQSPRAGPSLQYISPGLLLSYRNWMLKIGYQIPLQAAGARTFIVGVEAHL